MKKNSQLLIAFVVFTLFACSKPADQNDTAVSDTTEISDDYSEGRHSSSQDDLPNMTPEELAWVQRMVYANLLKEYTAHGTDYPVRFEVAFHDNEVMIVVHRQHESNFGVDLQEGENIDSLVISGRFYMLEENNGYWLSYQGTATTYDLVPNSDYSAAEIISFDYDLDTKNPTPIDLSKRSDSDIELSLKAMMQPLTANDLQGMSKDELAYLRNTIFARIGHRFKTPKMIEYFKKVEWYKGGWVDDATPNLTKLQRDNIEFIKKQETAI